MSENLKIDKKHSLFWDDGQNKFYILKLRNKKAFILSVFDKDKPHHIFFTQDDFTSLVCEIVKYCFDLPLIAREIPCPIDLTKKFHGCLKTIQTKPDKNGRVKIRLDERWLAYHGYPKQLALVWNKEKSLLYLEPIVG